MYAAYFAAKMGIGAVFLNDVGIGREEAGIAGMRMLDTLGVPGATVSHQSARIGDGADGVARGVLSFVNAAAAGHGLTLGMTCGDALAVLEAANLTPAPKPSPLEEARYELPDSGHPDVKVIVMDSISVDADRGIDDAGISRLVALDRHGIAGACASAFSARIGDGKSLYEDGYISVVNDTATQHGARIGMSCRNLAALFVQARAAQLG